jgi:hypothetical protein
VRAAPRKSLGRSMISLAVRGCATRSASMIAMLVGACFAKCHAGARLEGTDASAAATVARMTLDADGALPSTVRDASADSGGDPCEKVSAWGRRICCGRAGELPGFSCVDTSLPAPCTLVGETIDARVAQLHCCEGLHPVPSWVETDAGSPGFAAGCGPDPRSELESTAYCTACGDFRCTGPTENRCNCPEDCPP